MNRRSLFKRLLGTVAAVTMASAVELFAQPKFKVIPLIGGGQLNKCHGVPANPKNGWICGFDPAFQGGDSSVMVKARFDENGILHIVSIDQIL